MDEWESRLRVLLFHKKHSTFRSIPILLFHQETSSPPWLVGVAMKSQDIRQDPFSLVRASQVVPVVKDPPANSGDVRDVGSIPGSGRSPGGGHGNPPQYSCLGNPMDRGAWRAAVHGVAESQTWLSD